MIFTADPELKKQALLELRLEYRLDEQRPGLHQSELTHCLTQSYWDKTRPAPPTDKQVLLFAIGFMFERVMLSREETPSPIELDGITVSLDTIQLFGPADTKSTRMRAAGRKGEGGFKPPMSWERAFKSYRYVLNKTTGSTEMDFGVVVLHLIEPELTAWRYTFTQDELEEQWAYLQKQKAQLEWMLNHEEPQPFQHNQDYECEWCNHRLQCGLVASLQGLQKPSNLVQFPV